MGDLSNLPAPVRFRVRAAWERFWLAPVRAERLALLRVLLGLALLADQLLHILPHLGELYGPYGAAPAGLHDAYQLRHWRWTMLLFHGDAPAVVYPAFAAWVAAALLFTLGWHTRLAAVATWFLTLCFFTRNPNFTNSGDDVLQVGLFLLLFAPCGRALTLDAWRARQAGRPLSPWVPAWPVRLLQIQVCILYLSTGLIKLQGDGPFQGTWWDGTSVHYALNDLTLTRWSYAQLPVPLWLTAPLTYLSVCWEVLFTPLVLLASTRRWALVFGVLFHLGIWLSIEVGWFSFYILPFYAVWVPCAFWERRAGRGNRSVASPPSLPAAPARRLLKGVPASLGGREEDGCFSGKSG